MKTRNPNIPNAVILSDKAVKEIRIALRGRRTNREYIAKLLKKFEAVLKGKGIKI